MAHHPKGSPLAKAGILLTAANVGSGLLGYAYQVLMGRLLTPGDFALFSVFMALIMLIGSPLSAMLMIVSREVSALTATSGGNRLRSLYLRSQHQLALASIIFFTMVGVFIDPIQQWLKSPSKVVILIFSGAMIFSAYFTLNNAFFQGQQRFVWLGGSIFIGVLLKILLGALFIALGFGLEGALSGLLVSAAIVWLVGLLFNLYQMPRGDKKSKQEPNKNGWNRILPVIFANVAFAAMTQLDMVLVNRYFTAQEAGLYAAASVLGKAVLYLPGGLVFALFPMVATNHVTNQSSRGLLAQAILLTSLLCGLAALMYWFLGEWLIALLYSAHYQGAGELLRWYGLAMIPMALVMVAEHFLIAKGRILFAWLFLVMAPIQMAAIHYWHENLWNVMATMGLSGSLLVVLGYGMLLADLKKSEKGVSV